MNHFFSILLYNIAFLAIAFVIWGLLSVSFLLFKRLTFNKWALKKRDVPLKYNQVKTRRFAARFEIYGEVIPRVSFFCIFLSILHYSNLPFFALFFFAILLTTFTSMGNVGTLFTTKIVPSISNCCLFLRPFELEALSISDGDSKRVKIYSEISGEICRYLSQHVSQVLSIGNPQGMVDNIIHSVSIYASDEEWKNTIAILAGKAQVIVVHVGETNGCIWEIEHCSEQRLFDKVIFIVDSPEKLVFLRRLGILGESDSFSGIGLLVYRDLKDEQWCYKIIDDFKKADEEIEAIMRDYFSSRESIVLKMAYLDPSYENSNLDSEKKIKPRESIMPVEKPWIHRLSFLLCPFGYCFSNKWSESPMLRVMLSLVSAYLFLFIVGVFGLGKICSIIAYAIIFCVLGYWMIICPRITSREKVYSSDKMSEILSVEFLKKSIISFAVLFLALALFTWLHSFGLRLFDI